MQNSLGLLLLILFGGTGLISILIVVNFLLPVPVEKSRALLDASLGRCLLLGLVNFFFIGLLDVLIGWLGAMTGKVAGGLLVALAGVITLGLGLAAILGLAAMTSLVGQRTGSSSTPMTALLRGALLLYLAGLTPFLGWFVFTPLVIWTGLGAVIQFVFARKAGKV
jgi:hypothetical protein